MGLVLEKFVVHFHDIYGKYTKKFVEECGRKFFLLYLKPIKWYGKLLFGGTDKVIVEAVVCAVKIYHNGKPDILWISIMSGF